MEEQFRASNRCPLEADHRLQRHLLCTQKTHWWFRNNNKNLHWTRCTYGCISFISSCCIIRTWKYKGNLWLRISFGFVQFILLKSLCWKSLDSLKSWFIFLEYLTWKPMYNYKILLILGTRLFGQVLEKSTPWIQMRRTFPYLTFLHPVKWSPILLGSTPHTEFYCKVVVPWIYNLKAKVPNFTPRKYSENVTYFHKDLKVLNWLKAPISEIDMTLLQKTTSFWINPRLHSRM